MFLIIQGFSKRKAYNLENNKKYENFEICSSLTRQINQEEINEEHT
jgi:hypothetical protein